MGLEEWMGDLGLEDEQQETKADKEPGAPGPDYTYSGDKELLDVSFEEVKEVLSYTKFPFKKRSHPIGGKNLSVFSLKGEYMMVVTYPREHMDRDCLLVSVIDSETEYDVIEPYPVYLVKGWKEELKETIQTIKENQDELVFCDRCGGVMIIRKTNTTKEIIRGCSNYPECSNRDQYNYDRE